MKRKRLRDESIQIQVCYKFARLKHYSFHCNYAQIYILKIHGAYKTACQNYTNFWNILNFNEKKKTTILKMFNRTQCRLHHWACRSK